MRGRSHLAATLCRVALVSALCVSGRAYAQTYTFRTADAPYAPGTRNQGYYDRTGLHIAGPYYVEALASVGSSARNYLTFDLSALDLTSQVVTGATLRVTRFEGASPSGALVYEIFDVSTDALTLNTAATTTFDTLGLAIFEDLGTGSSYGKHTVPAADDPLSTLSLPLNVAALGDIAAAAGGRFSVGGTLTDIEPPGVRYLFAYALEPGTQELVVTTSPAKAATRISLYAAYGELGRLTVLRAILFSGATRVAGRELTFRVAGAGAGRATTDADGVATVTYPLPLGLGAGIHDVTVEFDAAADPGYHGTARTAPVLTAYRAPTALSFAATRACLGQTRDLRVYLLSRGGVAGRTVAFSVDGVHVGSANTDASGLASLAYAVPLSLGSGDYSVTASFAGDQTYAACTRTASVLHVSKAATGISLYAASGSPGQTVSLRCILVGAGSRLPGKTVSFAVDGVPAGTGVTDANGVAAVAYPLPAMSAGSHSMTAAFAGDATYAASSRSAAALTVQ